MHRPASHEHREKSRVLDWDGLAEQLKWYESEIHLIHHRETEELHEQRGSLGSRWAFALGLTSTLSHSGKQHPLWSTTGLRSFQRVGSSQQNRSEPLKRETLLPYSGDDLQWPSEKASTFWRNQLADDLQSLMKRDSRLRHSARRD